MLPLPDHVIHAEAGRRTSNMGRYEQPTYEVIEARQAYEVRFYESYLVAETAVAGDFDSTGNIAFRRLAGFIFGRNSGGVRMNMTVPVTHQPTADGSHRYRFVMEQRYTEQTLPEPADPSVAIKRIPAGFYAAFGYRGGRSERKYSRAKAALASALKRDGVNTVGDPAVAVYNGPATPPMLRRNEVLVAVAWPAEQAA